MNLPITAMLFLMAITTITNAMNVNYCPKNFEHYISHMEKLQKQMVLIVGCGHSYGFNGDHYHPNCWCVDIAREENQHYDWQVPWWQEIKADAELDITQPFSLSTTVKQYESKFDVVVLEYLWEETFKNPWTLFNAAYMLKIGGELIVDTCENYSFEWYDKKENDDENRDINLTQNQINSSEMAMILKRYGYDENTACLDVKELKGMAQHLHTFFFKNIVTIKNAYQPYTAIPGRSVRTGRTSFLLSAIKTEESQNTLPYWQSKLMKADR